MSLSKEQVQDVVSKYGKGAGDTGSTEVQVALLTAQIEALSEHLQRHTKDHHGRRGLLKMVGHRKRLLSYLEKNDYEGYKALIQALGLRH